MRLPTVWLAAAAILLVPGLASTRLPPLKKLRVPKTPVDLVWDRYAGFWSFLKEARHHVPPGESYTVIAADREDEMYLYMFSLGIFEKQIAMPSSYFGHATPDGDGARFVLAYRLNPQTGKLRVVARLDDGAVYERVAPTQ